MRKLESIGTAIYEDGRFHVVIHAKYRKGLHRIDDFSHLHMVGATEGGEFTIISGKVASLDKNKGMIWLTTRRNRLSRMDDRFDVFDIKPYMPSEDYAITTDCGTKHTVLAIQKDENGYQMEDCGEIRNTKGVTYLQFRDSIQMPKKLSEYIHVVWWFDKFEDKRYVSGRGYRNI
ncbi:MAG: hypothetical protein Q4D54_01460 [Eubacteriales bacterium]|nr:hypothetical protein [Lachnospiraceae bacterium]MDO5126399.1 hypothetical protein [Eubacteriales bacterium]